MIKIDKIKNTGEYFWTQHAQYKMKQYGLSEQRIRRVLRNPFRREIGIVKNTIAVMQPVSVKIKNGKKIWNQEIWVMYQTRTARNLKSKIPNPKPKVLNSAKPQLRIISAWRYPGISPKNNPIPEDILREISQFD